MGEESSSSNGESSADLPVDTSKRDHSKQIQLIAPSANPTGTSARPVIPTHVVDGTRCVPTQFQFCEMPDVIALVASMLDRLLAYNDNLLPDSRPLTRFHSKAAPAITPLAYLTRITTFTNVDPCILLILLHYIDKLNTYLTINSLTVHRFLISAVCCGSKALSDSFATNSRYAKVGGVELVEMNALEREFLAALGWRLATSGALLEQYWRSLVEAHPGYTLISTANPASRTTSLPSAVSTDSGLPDDPTPQASGSRPSKRTKS